MLISEATSNVQRKNLDARIVKNGLDSWRRQQDQAKMMKIKEQNEVRAMLEKYWPFGNANEAKPRGLKNLRLEGLFPHSDYQNAKRFVGTLDLGRPGGGAPLFTETGKRITRTREDPLLRFQFGSHDLRRCVDNTLRYKTNRLAQEQYRKELDKMVKDKKDIEEATKLKDKEFEKKQDWSDESAIKQFNTSYKESSRTSSNNKPRKVQPIFYPSKNLQNNIRNKKLTPLPESKENGIELVPLLAAKQKRYPLKLHLDTTDVTNDKKIHFSSIWNRQGSSYLKELTQQMCQKRQKFKEMKVEDFDNVRRHFSTLDAFWGRPGHGAPSSAHKKRKLDRLLYPQMVPIGVH